MALQHTPPMIESPPYSVQHVLLSAAVLQQSMSVAPLESRPGESASQQVKLSHVHVAPPGVSAAQHVSLSCGSVQQAGSRLKGSSQQTSGSMVEMVVQGSQLQAVVLLSVLGGGQFVSLKVQGSQAQVAAL